MTKQHKFYLLCGGIVIGTAATGEKAQELAEKLQPNLVPKITVIEKYGTYKKWNRS